MQNNPSYNAGALASAPIFDILTRKREGHIIDWTFHEFSYSSSVPAPLTMLKSIGSNATITASAAGKGGVLLSTSSSADGVGAQINTFGKVVPAVAAGVEVYYEVVMQVDAITTAYGSTFMGLNDTAGNGTSTPTYAVTATGGPTSTTDLLGIVVTGAGVVTLVGQEGNATDPTPIPMGTLVAATDVTMGFVVRGNNYVEAFYNGVSKGTWTSSTGLYNEAMYLDICNQGGASGTRATTIKRSTLVVAY